VPGSFFVYLDMVHEGVTWFADQKSKPARIPIQVRLSGQGEVTSALWRYIQHLKAENQQLKRRFLGLDGGPAVLDRSLANAGEPDLRPSFSGDFLGINGEVSIPKPPMLEIVNDLPRREDKEYERRELSDISHIAIHHSATPANIPPERIAAYHVYSKSHEWPGMGYHFYIGPEGTIYHTQDLDRTSWHVYKNNSYTVGVCLAGNFNQTTPPEPQLNATAWLTAWLMQELRIPIENVLGHKEFPRNATACPGYQWDSGSRWKDMLLEAIEKVRKGEIELSEKMLPHYVLLWKHEDEWAETVWNAAGEYIARFDATAGFSENIARLAELVTLVGGPEGVGVDVEARLRAAGCIVQRIAGKTPTETAEILQRMAREGRKIVRR